MKKRVIAIATGGTAGHVFPALALSEILGTKNEMLLFTDRRGKKYIDQDVTDLYIRNVQGNIIKKGFALALLGISTVKALYLLKRKKASLVVGFGGLSSFPVLYAARMLKIPIILHEQNSVLGKANKFFLKDAKLLATSFENTIGVDGKTRVIHTGNPIRSVVFDTKRRRTKITNEIYLLVTGGSQGARIFDETVAQSIISLPEDLQKRMTVIQQVRDIDFIDRMYKNSKLKRYELQHFFKDIPQLMADSDLIITRGGASALAEIGYLKIPSIIIPMAKSADNHQLHNANAFAAKGGARILTEDQLSANSLRELFEELLTKDGLDKLNNELKDSQVNNSAQKLALKVNEIIMELRL